MTRVLVRWVLLLGLSGVGAAGAILGDGWVVADGRATTGDNTMPRKVSPEMRRELLAAREAVWRAWFTNNRVELKRVIPEETIAINAGDGPWQDQAAVLAGAQEFAAAGGKLLRLEYPRTEMQVYGDLAILYTTYLFEVEYRDARRETASGRGTEIFVRRKGRWVNSGWHLDSGR